MGIRTTKQSKSLSRFVFLFLLTLSAALGAAGFILFFEGEKPAISLAGTSDFLAKTDTVNVEITDQKSGIRQISVTVSQGDIEHELYTVTNAREKYYGQVGPLRVSHSLPFDSSTLGFKDGPLVITVSAYDFSFRGMLSGNESSVSKNVTLDTKPPRIQILHSERYISPGGSGIVIYRLSDAQSRHGAVLNGKFNPGHLVGDGRDDAYIAFFALPYDADKIEGSKIEAIDIAGNKASVPFSTIYKQADQKSDRINIGDSFLSTKIPEFEQYHPEMSGSLLEKYLYTNQDIRQANNQKISELCSDSVSEKLWQGRFHRMAGSSRAGFADHRTYYYQGKPIDQQVHLGMDIASTRRADVKAANAGRVVYADYLGIYGNMVLLDHGQGVFSLYSHLSQINVAPEDMVDQQTVLGLTGTSGMAGGDHLHFSMLINGIFTTPKEWWDSHWIDVTINEPLVDSRF